MEMIFCVYTLLEGNRMNKNLGKSVIDIIGDVPWGTHICQFYDSKEDLTDILIPYFKVGLKNNEFCLWITAQPLEAEDAIGALGKEISDFDSYLAKGQIEIISYSCSHMARYIHDPKGVINYWIEKLNHAMERGYSGLRLSVNTSWLEKKDWGYFVDCMRKLGDIIGKYRMIALGSYIVDKYSTVDFVEVVSNHQFYLSKKEGKWEKINNLGRKKTEEAIIHATNDWKHTFDAVPDLIAILDTEFRIVRANKAMAASLRMTIEECIGMTCYRIVHGTDEPPFFCPHRQLLNDQLEHTVEICEDFLGGYFIVSVSPLHDSAGKLTGCIHVARNINERKEAEEILKKAHNNLEKIVEERTEQLKKAYNSLKESEKGLAEAQKMSHIGNWEWDITTDKAYWSNELYRIFRCNSRELAPSYNEYLSYVHPKDRSYVDNAFQKSITGKPYSIDHRIILANGEERTVHIQSKVIFDENKIPIRVKGIVQDVTERKKAEEKIRSLASIVGSSNDAILTISLDGIITSWNKGAEQIYGYSSEEVLENSVSMLAPDNLKGETKKLIEKVKFREKIHHYVTSRLRKDGKLIYVSIVLSPVLDASGELAAISAISRDITQRIEGEKSQVRAEKTRKKELHHRIKNNLQVISSLLDLQAEKFNNRECIKDSEVLEAFRESRDRVISMALIHEELYKGKEFETLDFSTYIRELVEKLFQTYRLNDKNICLQMDLEENAFLNMDNAVPFGIIVNELVSNSLKHAFSGRGEGKICITLRRKEEDRESINSKEENKCDDFKCTSFILKVSDNGIGIPKSLDLGNPDSLGMQLVTTLVDQLDGELELKRNNETEFIIRFIVTEKEKKIIS